MLGAWTVDLRITDLLVDLLDRYEPVTLAEDANGVVSEESGGLQAFGTWEILSDAPAEDEEAVMEIVNRLGLRDHDDFQADADFLAFPADRVTHDDLIALLEAVDATCDLLEVAGELDVHEAPITWKRGDGDPEPAPVTATRPSDEVPLLVEEVAIHLKRHAAPPPDENGAHTVHQAGIALFGRPYVLLRDPVSVVGAVSDLLRDAGLPDPVEARAHRLEWEEGALEPEDVYAIVNALRESNPVVGFTSGITWRNEALEVEEAE